MYMDLQEEVRFRVHSVKFNSIPTPAQLLAMQGKQHLPTIVPQRAAGQRSQPVVTFRSDLGADVASLPAAGDDKLIGTAARPFAPMEVIGDINGDGLGLSSWWAPVEDA